MDLQSLEGIEVKGRKVFVRCDFDVPIEDSKILDDSRLVSAISTIEYLLENGAAVIAAGHLGRPNGVDPKLSLEIVAKWFADEFPDSTLTKTKTEEFDSWSIKENFSVLENLRFDPGEEENSSEFTRKLANLAHIYVNEAFGSSHRSHASIVGVPKLLPHFAGFHLLKEIKILSGVLENPQRPLTIIVGGAKIETKLPLVEKMHKFADSVLVGGEIAENTKEFAKVAHENIADKKSTLLVADLTSDGKDIAEQSTQSFIESIKNSKTIVWNGPMGEFENCFDQGTRDLAQAIAGSSAYTIVGGGDTIYFLQKEGILDKFSFASMGGGAMLEFLSGDKLPGLIALQN